MSNSNINTNQLSELANLPIRDDGDVSSKLEENVASTIKYVSQISTANTENTLETHQVTGLENIFRQDVLDPDSTLSQDQALSNAKNTHQGYFVVKAVIKT